jgi:N-hydroxyarylamine O-acetyltransferase
LSKLNYFKNKPKVSQIDVDAYLSRLNLKKESATLQFLRKLHSSHVHTIPFENLDIHYRDKITLDYARVFDKLVTRKRGGFCYELNGLFYHLLFHLGYDCYITSAQMKNEDQTFDPDFGHMMIVVTIDDQDYLVDVGFGNSFLYPKLIDKGVVQMDYTTYWRFDTDPDENLLLQYSSNASNFTTKYMFRCEEKQIIQFFEMCEYHQTSPKSMFTQKKLISVKTTDGRITLTDRKLKILKLGEIDESPILNEDEFLSKLEQYFSISYHQLGPRKKS